MAKKEQKNKAKLESKKGQKLEQKSSPTGTEESGELK